jgi:competence protein ComEC
MAGPARIWLALSGLVAGVLCAGAAPVAVSIAAVAAPVSASRRRPLWRSVSLVAIAFAAGAVSAALRDPGRAPAAALAQDVPACRVAGRTLEDAGGLGLLAAVDRADCAGAVVEDAGAVFLNDVRIGPGRRFVAEGWLVPFGTDEFDRARQRAGASASFQTRSIRDLGDASVVHGMGGRVRASLATSVAPLGRAGQLLRGLTIGDTSGIDPDTEETLRRSGLAHLLAVSGSNVAILLGAVAFALRAARFVVRVGACALVLALFLVVVGPDASVLRAACMGAIALVALAWGRRTEPLSALGLALLVLVALRPGIVYSTGLHLSAAATAGIVLWTRPLAARLPRLPKIAAAAVAATLAAQVAVTPLLVGVFGRVPLGGLPANVLAMAAVPPATILGLAAAAAGPFAGAPARLLAGAAAPFAAWILRVGEAFAGVSWAAPEVPPVWGIFLAVPVVAAALRSIPGALRPGRA